MSFVCARQIRAVLLYMVLIFILVSLRQRGALDQSVVGDRLHSVHKKQRDVSEIGTHGSPNLQFQGRELLDGYPLLVRAHLDISFPRAACVAVEDLPFQIQVVSSSSRMRRKFMKDYRNSPLLLCVARL